MFEILNKTNKINYKIQKVINFRKSLNNLFIHTNKIGFLKNKTQ